MTALDAAFPALAGPARGAILARFEKQFEALSCLK